jgi:hypothetical protein
MDEYKSDGSHVCDVELLSSSPREWQAACKRGLHHQQFLVHSHKAFPGVKTPQPSYALLDDDMNGILGYGIFGSSVCGRSSHSGST